MYSALAMQILVFVSSISAMRRWHVDSEYEELIEETESTLSPNWRVFCSIWVLLNLFLIVATLLASGAFWSGFVYLAHDVSCPRQVSILVVKPLFLFFH
jgi:hypothetical protein